MGLWKFLRGTTDNTFGVGDGVNSTKAIEANVPGANKPKLRFNHTTGLWEFSHNGTDFFAFSKAPSDTAYSSGWDGVTDIAPSKNAVFDKINVLDYNVSYQQALDPEHLFNQNLSADGNWIGHTLNGTAAAALAIGDLCYFVAATSRWQKTNASAVATSGPVRLGMCVLAAAGDGSATTMILWGKVRADAKFPTLTISAPVFMGTTAGLIQVAAPSGSGHIIRIVGHAFTADELYFNPSNDWMEVT